MTMRKKLTTPKPTEPSDHLPANIRQALYVAASILRRMSGYGLDKPETRAMVKAVTETNGDKDATN